MENEKKVINYEEEAKKLQDREELPPYWKPTPGKYDVLSLGELTPFTWKKKVGEEEVEEESISLVVEIAKEKYSWTMGRGLTKASAFGQLVELAKDNNNKLDGIKFVVVVKSDGKKNDYTIV